MSPLTSSFVVQLRRTEGPVTSTSSRNSLSGVPPTKGRGVLPGHGIIPCTPSRVPMEATSVAERCWSDDEERRRSFLLRNNHHHRVLTNDGLFACRLFAPSHKSSNEANRHLKIIWLIRFQALN
ncbi:hypothetical protein LXL04_017135 [Taraxacum kok-saghyz]